MDSDDTHITCQICNTKFSNILLHLQRSPSCDEKYPLGPKQKLIKFYAKKNEDFQVTIFIIFYINVMQSKVNPKTSKSITEKEC